MATSPSDRHRPSPEELAAIVAAVGLVWPSPPDPSDPQGWRRPSGWRFSGRWWHPDNAGHSRLPRLPGR